MSVHRVTEDLEEESLSPVIERVKHARRLLRDAVEVLEEPYPLKRLRMYEFSVPTQPPAKSKLPEIKPFNAAIEPVPPIHLPSTSSTRPDPPIPSKPAHSIPPPVPISTPKPPSIPVNPSPHSIPPKPQSDFIKAASQSIPKPTPKPVTPPPAAASFFVSGPVATDAFIEDSGFMGGEDSSEGGSGSGGEETSAPANSFFNSGSLFTKQDTAGSLFGKPGGEAKDTSTGSLFSGATGANVFAAFNASSQASNPFAPRGTPLFPFSVPPS